ncbi:FMN-binding domain protein [Clostridiales bacterium oral taxon 876 str. F0540]|nr:FMN-binding domain protein [Clostridiales bacterium oral taxon 876 str. F0540]
MKKIIKVILSIVTLFILITAGGMFYMTRGLDKGIKQKVNSVNLSSIKDGVYKGKYNSGRWSNEVNVTIKDHKITKIDMVKDVTFSKPELKEQIFSEVLDKQNVDVDVVSGGTITSKAYLKSIESALNN